MSTIPTAEEILNRDYTSTKENAIRAMIEFAKLHVEAALKEASKKAKITYDYSGNTGSEYCDEFVDKDSILNSYPLDKIK